MPEHYDEEKSDIEQLQEIMALLPDSCAHDGPERRKYSLTKDDVLIIFRIAKIANDHNCPFGDGEPEVLQSVAKNITRTQKIATGIIIVGVTTATLSGVLYALKHAFLEWVKTGGKIP